MKLNKRFLVLIASILLCFISLSACSAQEQKRDTTLNLDNYSTYITITRGGLGGGSGTGEMFVTTNIRIRRNQGVELDNVNITFVYTANEFSQTFTENVGELRNEFIRPIQFTIAWSSGMSLLDIDISVEVTAVSGTIISAPPIQTGPSLEIGPIIIASIALVLVISLLIFFIFRAYSFSNKVDSIKNGMTYNEVIQVLGSPRTSKVVGDIRTCTWSRAVIRGVFNNHVITFKNDRVILVDGNTNYGMR